MIYKVTDSKIKARLKSLGVALVYLYGSEALGVASRFSDLDVGIVLKEPLLLDSGEKRDRLRSKLLQCLEGLTAEKGDREVDLVFLQTASSVLQFEAIHAGRLLFAGNPVFQADYEEGVIRDYLDIRPLVETHYRAVLDRAA